MRLARMVDMQHIPYSIPYIVDTQLHTPYTLYSGYTP